ncbi:MAG: hypothetical protein FWG66_03170 [Spirochaetes bacterium]|nr:hypothetical protein [Spirochaetota bacterium]
MNTAMLTELFYCFIVLGVLLLIGTFLRAVIPAFQKVFLPASVIGGFIGLIFGPIVLDIVPIPRTWINIWALLPGLLIVPVIASTPLGMKLGGSNSTGKASADASKTFSIMMFAGSIQIIIGLITLGIFPRIMPNLEFYPTFGFELASGFAGGHGTAGVLGGFLQALGLPFWETAQGVTVTTATIGIIGGMVFGIAYINIAARRGKTALLKKPSDIPADLAKGIQLDMAKQASTGKETTYSSSVESQGFHLSVIFLACGVSYLLMNFVRANNIPVITQVPIWTYSILVMFGLNFLIHKLKLGVLICSKTKSKITGTLSDFAITAAIASLPLQAIITYIVPILFMCVAGFILTIMTLDMLGKYAFSDYHTERTMANFGAQSGVFLTGLMLLKICDPDYELPVINDYSMAFSFNSLTFFILMPIQINLMLHSGVLITLGFNVAICLSMCIMLFALNKARPRVAKSA